MNLYNMLHGYSSACITILPMLGRKPEDYPRFRDCVVLNSESIVIYARVGGNNRGCGYGEEELLKDPNFIRTFDDAFDSTYGYYLFTVPDKWKKDFEAIMDARFFDVSDEYVEYLEQFWANIAEKGAIRKIFREEGQLDEEYDHRPD